MAEPGKKRCRFHGGRATGPKTQSGKVRALTNLRQFATSEDEVSKLPIQTCVAKTRNAVTLE
ncbi:HGGxSTG domain-containing protein [Ahniella affigens]|uniref:HGGxSTG domain-containing protein n=1 Tax=Ahniella affigens TaxID=2021234 RepID=UPI003CCCDE58